MTVTVTNVLVHGVGLSPDTFDTVAASLPGPTLTWVRPGYDGTPGPVPFTEQVEALAGVVADRAPARVVGVSGGATLALALAATVDPATGRGPEGLVGVVTHEPLVGALEPELDARVADAGRRLDEARRTGRCRTEAADFLTGLYGPDTWSALPAPARAWADGHTEVVCGEVAHFASYQPTRSELAAITVPHVTTVGDRSGQDRHRVARLIADLGARMRILDHCGHLANVEQPDQLAEAARSLDDLEPTREGGR